MHIEEIIAQEIALVSKITGVEPRRIELNQGGLQCRVYIINDGQIVFKFPRKNSKGQHSVRFDVEKKVVGIVNQLPQTVSLPKVLYESNNDSYLGFTGVKGENLKYGKLSKIQAVSVGKQVANFIKQLHIYSSQNRNLTVPIYGLESQIEIWLGWYNKEIFKSLGFTLV
ncbi:MAG: hypothetical protein FWD32_02515, partial [Firmicutes bacterium]|nr:hypothetical protein [Bacillota bacterium]